VTADRLSAAGTAVNRSCSDGVTVDRWSMVTKAMAPVM
jgi:hypothetical protein